MKSLALLITALLFAQWPLREGVGAGSTQANDLAQWLFALYVAYAVQHAGKRGGHLVARPDLAHNAGQPQSAWRRIGAPLCVLPWALFLLFTSVAPVVQSVVHLERFPETNHPGYFIVKLALVLLAALLAAQSSQSLWRAMRRH